MEFLSKEQFFASLRERCVFVHTSKNTCVSFFYSAGSGYYTDVMLLRDDRIFLHSVNNRNLSDDEIYEIYKFAFLEQSENYPFEIIE